MVASIYYNDIKDLISLKTDSSDDLLVFDNVEEATAEGAELELIAQYDNGWAGSFSYSFQNAEDGSGERLVNSARHLTKLNLNAPLLENYLHAGLEVQYESGRKTLSGDETDERIITNLTLFSENWVNGLEVSASVYDLFDQAPAVPGFEEHEQEQIAQDGRTFRLKLAYAFY